MQDLKHLITFEKLLDDAANDLVKEAQARGQYAIGYTCYHMPEVLLNVDNCFHRHSYILYVQLHL